MGETGTKVEVKTAVYKVHVHCGQCARDIETQFTEFKGVEEVKLDAGAGKVTVKGFGFDVEKLRVKVEKGCRKKVELIPPPKDIITEIKTKEEVLKVITVKVPLHCPECAVRVKEILLEHKSIYEAKTDLGKNTCVVEGVINEEKLVEYIYQRTRKHGSIDKVETKVIIKEEKVEVKKEKEKLGKKKEIVKEVVEAVKEKVTEVVAPYFIPCTHPHFVDYSHPWHRRGGHCSPYPYYGDGCGNPYYGVSYTHSELTGYHDTAFLHCAHPNEFISDENPYACSVM
ncbi:heavy metal-associated isoprenylated plant protein 4-like [Phragmites australis]|uniref:heavy metal-associated isoprenylated plant protein 4-like n=1 Tax=Phragmites australis TaxID=29695 RepID=UPI002D784790|nr:heavy metal-associated isoprenylated plant protein 4-like [Phragmites australis]